MNYDYLWKVLEDLLNELSKKKVTITQELFDDLKSVRTLINIYSVDPTAQDVATEIEVYMEKLESNLLYLAESDIGAEYADEWLKRIYEARKKGVSRDVTPTSRFVSGVPKGDHWIRIKTLDLISVRDQDQLLKKFNLSSKAQNDDYLLIHGKEKNVKAFIKTIGEKIRKKGGTSFR